MKQSGDKARMPAADMAAVAEASGPEAGQGNKLVERPERPAAQPATPSASAAADIPGALLEGEQTQQLRTRWSEVQTNFVDAPRQAVEQADALVADAIQRLSQSFADRRALLESGWNGGRDASTEDLRLALRQYRSFFDRLLSL